MKYFFIVIIFIVSLFQTIIFSMDDSKPISFATECALKAIELDSVPLLQVALSRNADITYNDKLKNHLLLIASKKNKENSALYLLKQPYFQQADILNQPNAFGETLLVAASFKGQKKLVTELLKTPEINIDFAHEGYTALHYATTNNQLNIIELLVSHGANTFITNTEGATIAFYRAMLNPKKEFTHVAQKIFNQIDKEGNTHLHMLAKVLIDKMAELSKSDPKNLFYSILDHLIKNGVSIWSKNKVGRLPIEIAYEQYQKRYALYKQESDCYSLMALKSQEKVLHMLCFFYNKEINDPNISRSVYAHQLNIETEIAYRFKDKEEDYSKYCLEFRDTLKNDLSKNIDTIPKIWIVGYTPPQILD